MDTETKNILLPPDLHARVQEWSGGQSSATYKLMCNALVSVSMLEAAADELDCFAGAFETLELRFSREDLSGELRMLAAFPEEFRQR